VSDPTAGRSVVGCGGYHFFIRNREEFERICQDVFAGHEYGFETRRRAPVIIDAGAHVGVATHYFKHRFPHARVLAVEANPVTFALLRKNISHNGLDDVRAIHAALAPQAGTIPFFTSDSDEEPGAWGDSAIQQPWHEGEATAVVHVPAITLGGYTSLSVKLRDSADNSVWADVAGGAWTNVTAVGAERIVVGGTVRRYRAIQWTLNGAGSGPSFNIYAALA